MWLPGIFFFFCFDIDNDHKWKLSSDTKVTLTLGQQFLARLAILKAWILACIYLALV